MDWASLLYAPIYATLGVEAVLTVACGDPPMALTVIDKTAPAAINFRSADVLDIKPACMVRAADLADVDKAKLRDASITFNGNTWTVKSHELIPAPTGEGQGEIRLILEAA